MRLGAGAEAAGAAHGHGTDRARNAAQGPHFGLTRFRACTARKLQRDNGADLAADVVVTRGAETCSCGESRWLPERTPRPAIKSCPEPTGCLGTAGEGGRWVIREHYGSQVQIIPLREFFVPGRLFHSPYKPVRPGSDPADLQRGDLFKECCCHRSFSDAETLFISELQHSVKEP